MSVLIRCLSPLGTHGTAWRRGMNPKKRGYTLQFTVGSRTWGERWGKKRRTPLHSRHEKGWEGLRLDFDGGGGDTAWLDEGWEIMTSKAHLILSHTHTQAHRRTYKHTYAHIYCLYCIYWCIIYVRVYGQTLNGSVAAKTSGHDTHPWKASLRNTAFANHDLHSDNDLPKHFQHNPITIGSAWQQSKCHLLQ